MSFMPMKRSLRPWERRNREAQLAADRVPVIATDQWSRANCAECRCERNAHLFYSDACNCGHCAKFVEIQEAA